MTVWAQSMAPKGPHMPKAMREWIVLWKNEMGKSTVHLMVCFSNYNVKILWTGAKLIYLPPYSPDFNSIEQSFHSLKAWLRRHEAQAVNPECHPWLIHQAAASLTPEMAESWILNCGYYFSDE